MANVFKGLTIKIGADTTKLSSALRKAKDSARGVSSELKAVGRALKINPGNVQLLTRQQELYKQKIKATEEELKALRIAEEQIGESDMNTDQWTKLQSEIAICEANLKEYNKALRDSQIEQDASNSKLGQAALKLQKIGPTLKTVGDGMQTVGRGLSTTVTPAIVGTGAASVAAAVKIDTALTGVKKTVDGTEEQYQSLKEAAIEFSKTNAVSADQILDIQALGAQLGFTIDELDMFSQVISGLDIATNMDAETAAIELANFANITGMSHDEVTNYGAAIVGLGNNFATTESDISAMAMCLASAGTQVGMSEADILGLATALSSMGMEAEAGGSSISTIMMQIDKDVATNSDALKTWASTAGMSANEFANAWKKDPVDALTALLTNMDKATKEGDSMSVMLDELGVTSIRQTDAMRRLAGNSEFVEKAIGKANEEWEKNSALNKEVANRNESLAAKFQILKNKVVAVAESVGKPLADALIDVVDAAEPLIQNIAKAAESFADMDEGQQKAVLSAVAMTAALGPALSIIGKGVSTVGGMGTSLMSLAKFLAKVGGGYKDLGAASGVAGTAISKSAKSTKAATTAMKASSVATGALKTSMIGLGVALAGLLITKAIEEFEEYRLKTTEVKNATNSLKEAVDAVNGSTAPFAESMSTATKSVEDHVNELHEAIKETEQLGTSMREALDEINTSGATLDGAISVIERYANRTNLTKYEQQQLTEAVKTYNKITGSNIEVTDAQNGKLSESTEKLKENAQAWLENAKSQAVQEKIAEWEKQRISNTVDLQEAQEKLRQAEKERQELEQSDVKDASYQRAMAEKDAAVKELKDEIDSLNETNADLADKEASFIETEYGAIDATNALKLSIADFADTNERFATALKNAGIGSDDFGAKMANLGFSVTDLSELTEEQLQGIVNSFDGSEADILAVCEKLGISVPDKLKQAVEDGARCVSEGKVDIMRASIGVKDGMLTAFDPITGEFQELSQEAIDGFCKELGIKAPDLEETVKNLKDGAVYNLNPVTGKFKEAGEKSSKNFVNALDDIESARAAAKNLKEGAEEGVKGTDSSTKKEGKKASKAFSDGVKSEKSSTKVNAKTLSDAVKAGVKDTSAVTGKSGEKASQSFASGVGSKKLTTQQKAQVISSAAKTGMTMNTSSATTWGSHLGSNFASGISNSGGLVRTAANELAGIVQRVLGHTIPKEGPLHNGGKGEIEWGEHTVQNYIDGVNRKLPELKKTMSAITETVANPLKGTALESGKLGMSTDMSVKVTHAGLSKNDIYKAIVEALAKTDTGNNYDIDMTVDAKSLSGINAVEQFVKALELEKRANPSRR